MTPADRLSWYFSYGEAVASQTADRLGIDNTPPPEALARIKQTALKMDEIRRLLGSPIHVTSWYRCPELNERIGGSRNSQHMVGEAVDFVSPQFGPPSHIIRAVLKEGMEALHVDQLILEFPNGKGGGWVHVSFSDSPRHQALIVDGDGTRRMA
jgi:hypothetical protein